MLVQLVFVALLPFGHQRHAPVHLQRRRIGAWTLVVRTDRFSDGVKCRLWKKGVEYGRGAIAFRFNARLDTAGAVYRVDGGDPSKARGDEMELARLGVDVHRDDLLNPSQGMVLIPADRLVGAGVVRIQPTARSAPVAFRVDGLDAALEAANDAGCDADDFGDPPFGQGRD